MSFEGFEVFDRRVTFREGRGGPTIRISEDGRMLIFNAAAARLIEGIQYVRLMFDRDGRRIGFQPTDKDDENGFSIGRPKSAANMHAKSFVQAYNIPTGQRFPLTQEGDVFIAQLPG